MSDDPNNRRFAPRSWNTFLDSDAPRGLPVADSPDLTRIVNLPRRPQVTEGSATAAALVQMAMERFGRGPRACACRDIDPDRFKNGKDGCIHTASWIQAWMLYEMGLANGLIGHVPPGSGKTLPFVLAPLAVRNCESALLLVPPTLIDQVQIDWRLIAEHFRVPTMLVHVGGKRTLTFAANPRPDGGREPIMHVLPYSKVSSMDESSLMERLRPDLVIADECDALSSTSSSRTMRFLRYFGENQSSRLVCGTGSLTNASPSEYGHLAYVALRERSPLPEDPQVTDDWARCVGAVPNPAPAGALKRLLNPGEPESDIRKAFGRRIAETLGFIVVGGKQVITTSSGTEVELVIRERPIQVVPAIVLEALEKVRNNVRPDTLGGSDHDEVLVDPMEQARCAREVSTGMFYRWVFPRGEPRPLRDLWYEARKLWRHELRSKFLRGEVHLDSPGLCERAARRAWGDLPPEHLRGCVDEACRGCAPEWKAEHWCRWRDIADQVQPETASVRLHPFLVEDAAQWALEEPGIVWYGMTEFAEWLSEISDLPVYGGGKEAGRRIVSDERGDRSVIASMKAHGRGRDRLQYTFHRQLVANIFASSRQGAQLLARLHRRNQEALEVVTDVYIHTPELKKSLRAAMMKGAYVRETMTEEQKLLDAWQGDDLDDPSH